MKAYLLKYLILFLISTLAYGDVYIQRVSSEQTGNGYMFRFVENGQVKCWGMPDMLDPSFVPQTWTLVTQAAIKNKWPLMTGKAAEACLSGPPIPRVVEMNEGEEPVMFGINKQRLTRIGTIPAGTPCGDFVANYYSTGFQYRTVSYGGKTGMALCL